MIGTSFDNPWDHRIFQLNSPSRKIGQAPSLDTFRNIAAFHEEIEFDNETLHKSHLIRATCDSWGRADLALPRFWP